MYCLIDMCCICLSSNNCLKYLSSKDCKNVTYLEKLSSSFQEMHFDASDNLQMICNLCSYKLDISYDFHKQCIDSRIVLNNYLDQLKSVGDTRGTVSVSVIQIKVPSNWKKRKINWGENGEVKRKKSEYFDQIQELKRNNLQNQRYNEIDSPESPLNKLQSFVSSVEERFKNNLTSMFNIFSHPHGDGIYGLPRNLKLSNFDRYLDRYDLNKDFTDDSDDDSEYFDENDNDFKVKAEDDDDEINFEVSTDRRIKIIENGLNFEVMSGRKDEVMSEKCSNINKLQNFMDDLSKRLNEDRIVESVEPDGIVESNLRKLEEVSNKIFPERVPIRPISPFNDYIVKRNENEEVDRSSLEKPDANRNIPNENISKANPIVEISPNPSVEKLKKSYAWNKSTRNGGRIVWKVKETVYNIHNDFQNDSSKNKNDSKTVSNKNRKDASPGDKNQNGKSDFYILVHPENKTIPVNHNSPLNQNIPIGSQNIPIGSQNVPIGSQNISIGSQNIPIGMRNVPIGNQNILLVNKIVPTVSNAIKNVPNQKIPVLAQTFSNFLSVPQTNRNPTNTNHVRKLFDINKYLDGNGTNKNCPETIPSTSKNIQDFLKRKEKIDKISNNLLDVKKTVLDLMKITPNVTKTVSNITINPSNRQKTVGRKNVPNRQKNVPNRHETVPNVTKTVPIVTKTVPIVTKTVPNVTKTVPIVTKTPPKKIIPNESKKVFRITDSFPNVTKKVLNLNKFVATPTVTVPDQTKTVPNETETSPTTPRNMNPKIRQKCNHKITDSDDERVKKLSKVNGQEKMTSTISKLMKKIPSNKKKKMVLKKIIGENNDPKYIGIISDSNETIPNNNETIPNNNETIPNNNETVSSNNETISNNNETISNNYSDILEEYGMKIEEDSDFVPDAISGNEIEKLQALVSIDIKEESIDIKTETDEINEQPNMEFVTVPSTSNPDFETNGSDPNPIQTRLDFRRSQSKKEYQKLEKLTNLSRDSFEKYLKEIKSTQDSRRFMSQIKSEGQKLAIKALICSKCGLRTKSSNELLNHLKIDHSAPPYPCNECKLSFNYPEAFESHVRSHTNRSPYQCLVCMKKFNLITNLKVHLRLHSRDASFLCTICGRIITMNEDSEGFSNCESCSKIYIKESELCVKKIVIRNYKCGKCGEVFPSRYKSNIHTQECKDKPNEKNIDS